MNVGAIAPRTALVAALAAGCEIAPIYYPDMGSNGLTWQDTADSDAPAGGSWDGSSTLIVGMGPGDAPFCATGDESTLIGLSYTNETPSVVEAFAVDDDCVETWLTSTQPGQFGVVSGHFGAAYVLRVADTGEPLYTIRLGWDGANFVVQ